MHPPLSQLISESSKKAAAEADKSALKARMEFGSARSKAAKLEVGYVGWETGKEGGGEMGGVEAAAGMGRMKQSHV